MTLSEFKAWFEGFTESMDGPPSLKQWERIQGRVKEITGAPVSYPVFVDRYLPAVKPWWADDIHRYTVRATGAAVPYATLNAGPCQAAMGVGAVNFASQNQMQAQGRIASMQFDSHSAMNALGKADADALKAA